MTPSRQNGISNKKFFGKFFAREDFFFFQPSMWKLSSEQWAVNILKTFEYNSLGFALQLTVKWTTNLIRFAFAIHAMSTDNGSNTRVCSVCICNETDTMRHNSICHKTNSLLTKWKLEKKEMLRYHISVGECGCFGSRKNCLNTALYIHFTFKWYYIHENIFKEYRKPSIDTFFSPNSVMSLWA